ncbi:MAG: carboxypeptidase regulatory-like domain-containing protein [Candidatus Aminicenantales bacterium]
MQKKRTSLKRVGKKRFLFVLLVIILALASRSSLQGSGHANFWGKIINHRYRPLESVRVYIQRKESHFEKAVETDAEGLFVIWGIPFGHYTIHVFGEGYHPYMQDSLELDPDQTLFWEVILLPLNNRDKSFAQEVTLDYTSVLLQTLLPKKKIHQSPSAHNVWSLVENQDFSATTNRIDVGGLWSSFPALFSIRGACSWTQNIYLLNGLDVTDPYQTGMPLFYPDFFSLEFSRLTNAGFFPPSFSPGGYFDLLTQEETSSFHGQASVFFIHKAMQSTNISPALEKEGMTESHSFNSFLDGNLSLSGPVIPEKLLFSSSFSAFHISRNIADYDESDDAKLISGLLSLKRPFSHGSLRLLWTGQLLSHPSFGAGRQMAFSSTWDRRDVFHVFQLLWNSTLGRHHFFEAGICYNLGSTRSRFQDGFNSPHREEVLKNVPRGLAPFAHEDSRNSLTLLFKGDTFISRFFHARHRFQYGFQLRYCSSLSRKEIFDDIHLRYFEGRPLEVVRYNTPVEQRESALNWHIFAQDALTFSSHFTAIFGLHLVSSQGWIPLKNSTTESRKKVIQWLHLSPHLGIIFPLSRSKNTALKFSIARFYFTFPLYYLSYGNPDALGGRVYAWDDSNGDGEYQEGEAGSLIRREGPLFSAVDSGLKRPYTDEMAVSFHYAFGKSWSLTLGGFFRESRNLIETINIGVPFSSYDPVSFFDIGDDRIANTPDDLTFIVYNQRLETLGQDFFFLTNPDPEERTSRYYGFDLTLVKKYREKFHFFLSLTATSATGITNPGNTEWENDDGVVGRLYDDPNTLINAKGRMRFDRAYTGRLGAYFMVPFDVRVGCIIKYYDGQPFTRKIIVKGMNQGPFTIQAFSRGVARYEYNLTIDIRLEKIFRLQKGRIRVILDGFNILNSALATEENEWTGPEFPLRFATEIQSPRVFRLGVSYEF